MREVDGKTVAVHDRGHKRRKDYMIDDQELIKQTQARIQRRHRARDPEGAPVQGTRMERYIVACYAAEDGGHFRAHRDNTTKGTAHRRFAVSINLNAGVRGRRAQFSRIRPAQLQAAARRRGGVLLLAAACGRRR